MHQASSIMATSINEPPTLLQDLKVTIQDVSLVFPSQPTNKKSFFLSNIDQVLNFNVQTVHFFESHKDFASDILVNKLKKALEDALVPYHFLAGRLEVNPTTGRAKIDCNGAGAGFVVASSGCMLEELGDLVYPNPAFAQLIVDSMDELEKHGKPLCVLQVTTFKCGGFVIGCSTSHATFDGLSFKMFLENLAALVADKPLAVVPCNDRTILAARSPPQVTFPHPELLKLDPSNSSTPPPVFDNTQEALDFKIFRLSSETISDLKEKVKTESGQHVSSFNVVTALIWRCKALSFDSTDQDRISTILFAVDIRSRLIPPLSASYCGNAVLTAYASAKCNELQEGPFSRLTEMVQEGTKRMTDEYARSIIDWGDIYKGFPHGEFLLSSWWKLGFDQVEYPWGRPRYSCPVVYRRKDIILLFPDTQDANAVNVLVALPSKEMETFQRLIDSFLLNP